MSSSSSYAFFAVVPQSCLKCKCFHEQIIANNVFDCSQENLYNLPSTAPNQTNSIVSSDNYLTRLCDKIIYSRNVTFLNVSSNNIQEICEAFLDHLNKYSSIHSLDLSNNSLTSLPRVIKQLTHLKQIWLKNNQFKCKCDMLWMKDWLANSTTSSGEHVVRDYEEVTCKSEYMIGQPIYKLDKVQMGCYPQKIPRWGVVIISLSVFLMLTIAATLFIISRRWNEVKFWMYKHFDILDKRDRGEDLDGKEFDGLVSYRFVVRFLPMENEITAAADIFNPQLYSLTKFCR